MAKKQATNVMPWNDGASLIDKGTSRPVKEYKVPSISNPNSKQHCTAKVQSDEDTFLIDAMLLPHTTVDGVTTWDVDTVTFRIDDGRITIV